MAGLIGQLTLTTSKGVSFPLGICACPLTEDLETILKRKVSPSARLKLAFTFEAKDGYAKSLGQGDITVKVYAGKEKLCETMPECTACDESFSFTVKTKGATLVDVVGPVALKVVITNAFDVTETLLTQSIFVGFENSGHSLRLKDMLWFIYDRAHLLMHAAGPNAIRKTPGKQGQTSKTPSKPETGNFVQAALAPRETQRNLKDQIALIAKVIQTFGQLRNYFERNARFRLQHRHRLTAFTRVQAVTHRTLEFIANHPQYLVPTHEETGIRFGNRNYVPDVTTDESLHKSYKIYENQSLVNFLVTVLQTCRNLSQKVIAHPDSIYSQTILADLKDRDVFASQLEGLVEVYCRLFGIDERTALTTLPEPTSIFCSSAHYRSVYELMREWFDCKRITPEEESYVESVSNSSRLYEHYVLTQLVSSLQSHLTDRRPVVYPGVRDNRYETQTYNVFTFEFDDKRITLYYEPAIAAGSLADNGVGLVRTVTLDYANDGLPLHSENEQYWTPDYVIKIEEKGQTRFWIADAKYSVWTTAVKEYAQQVFFNYLLATSPTDPKDTVAGLIFFCGKDNVNAKERALEVPFNLRNLDKPAHASARGNRLQVLTLAAGDIGKDKVAVENWLRAL